MREFHQHLPKLLKPGGIYSYFNGLCGDNAFFHAVYCQLVALELANLGYSTQFIPLPVKDCLAEEIWKGVKQKYWQLDTYYLPACQSESESEWKFCQSSNGVFVVCVWRLLSVLSCYICSGMLCFKLVPFHFQELNFLSACDNLPLLYAPDACVRGP